MPSPGRLSAGPLNGASQSTEPIKALIFFTVAQIFLTNGANHLYVELVCTVYWADEKLR